MPIGRAWQIETNGGIFLAFDSFVIDVWAVAQIIPFDPKSVQVSQKRAAQTPKAPVRGRKQAKALFFDREEFGRLLSLYSGQVAKGTWRDYAVDFLPGQALFSVYRHAHEAPVLTISKQVRPNGKGREYLLYAGPRRLARADDLSGLNSHILMAAQKA